MDVKNSDIEYYCDFDNDKLLVIKNLSFDIKNALNGLSGFINLLDKCIVNPEQKKLLKHIKYSDMVLNYLSESLLRIAKQDEYVLRPNFSKIKLKSLLTKSLMLLKLQIEEKNIEIKFEIDEKISDEIYGNSVKLFETVNNLLEYTLQSMVSGSINFKVELIKEENGRLDIEFSIVNDCKTSLNVKTILDFENYIRKISLQSGRENILISLAIANELLKQCNSCLNYEALTGGKEKLSFIMNFLSYSNLLDGYC